VRIRPEVVLACEPLDLNIVVECINLPVATWSRFPTCREKSSKWCSLRQIALQTTFRARIHPPASLKTLCLQAPAFGMTVAQPEWDTFK